MDGLLTSVFVANGLGAILTAIILAGNVWRIQNRKSENICLLSLLVLVLINCLVDPSVFASDGRVGALPETVNKVGNSWLYISNMFCSFFWLFFLAKHVCGGIGKIHLRLLLGLIALGIVGVAINCFKPFIFSIDAGNVYHRMWGYWIYAAIDYGVALDSLVFYFWSRRKNGMLNVFPIWVYYIPMSLGVLAQTMVYGVSLISSSLAVAMAGIFSSLQNELIFRDHLTGLYNRIYLDFRLRLLMKQKRFSITGMMLDLNSFKKINDVHGHSAGDAALVNLAEILQSSIEEKGVVIRYAGDEFIVLLISPEEFSADEYLKNLNENLSQFNATSGEPYQLSISYGVSELNAHKDSIDDFIKTMDHNMYENKRAYYAKNGFADRRGSRS